MYTVGKYKIKRKNYTECSIASMLCKDIIIKLYWHSNCWYVQFTYLRNKIFCLVINAGTYEDSDNAEKTRVYWMDHVIHVFTSPFFIEKKTWINLKELVKVNTFLLQVMCISTVDGRNIQSFYVGIWVWHPAVSDSFLRLLKISTDR